MQLVKGIISSSSSSSERISKSKDSTHLIFRPRKITIILNIPYQNYQFKMITSNKKTYHFVIVGTLEDESKEVAFEFLKALMKKEEIKELSELHIFGEKDNK